MAYAGDEEAAVVKVNGTKNPDIHSYRSVVAGLDAFDDHHQLAPAATQVRFRLNARSGEDLDTSTLSLRIVGDGDPIPVPFAADGTFSVPRVQAALDENADLILNRRKGELRGWPEIRTPGLPANIRRLGDLRLECQVQVAIIKNDMSFLLRATLNTLLLTSDWCNIKNGQFWIQAPGQVADAVIREGTRQQAIGFHDKSFQIPITDASWSNEALIELQFEPELTTEQKAHPWEQALYLMGSMNQWAAKTRLQKLEDGVFKAQLDLPAGRHEFKVGGNHFIGVDLGGATKAKQTVVANTPITLAPRGSNLVLNVEREGSYDFVLDARNSEAPALTVTRSSTL